MAQSANCSGRRSSGGRAGRSITVIPTHAIRTLEHTDCLACTPRDTGTTAHEDIQDIHVVMHPLKNFRPRTS